MISDLMNRDVQIRLEATRIIFFKRILDLNFNLFIILPNCSLKTIPANVGHLADQSVYFVHANYWGFYFFTLS